MDNTIILTTFNKQFIAEKEIKYINNWGLSNDLNVNWYFFGDSTRRMNSDEILFSDNTSSLDGIEKNIILNQQSNHLIITDGQINKGQKLDDIIIDNKNIYISGFGKDIDGLIVILILFLY